MTNRSSTRRFLAFTLLCLLLAMPTGANAGAGKILSLLTTITGTLRNGVGQVLSRIQTLDATVRNFEQQVVWPVTLIAQTRASVEQVHAQLTDLSGQIHRIQTSSATLVDPARLEAILRSERASNLRQIDAAYTRIYQPLPRPDQATVSQRNLMDVDDALALGALKAGIVSDQASGQMLAVADRLERQARVSAPGSAPLLTAQAHVANLESQAMLLKMLAAALRQEAGQMAHRNALYKMSADTQRKLRGNLLEILSRP